MTSSSRSRFVVLVAALAALATMIIWAASTSWLEVRAIRKRFAQIEASGTQSDVGRLRALIFRTTATLFTFEVTDRVEDRLKLEERQAELGAWMTSTKGSLLSPEETALFAQIDEAYLRYVDETRELADANPVDEPKEVMASRFVQIERASERLLVLAAELTTLRRQSFGKFIRESERSVVILQQLIFAALLAFLFVAAWGVWIVYRDTIAPLRLKLVETREIAERQKKLASLGVLAAGVAHEIRNPLTAIKARLFTQKKALTAGTSAYTDGEFIGNEITRLERIVRDFLLFARPAPSQRTSIFAGDLLEQVRELLGPELRENQIELALVSEGDVRLEGDSQQLQQVLINLVQNAADSIGVKGRITLRVRTDKIALSENVREVVILEVEDNGKGIPADVQQRLFDPFYSTKSTGTGLGLSIAARIVEQHGGALQYQTQVDRGTTFGVILPAKVST
ncbi:MAG: two-component system sensor histidine kinase NtrB [Chthoniobacterales bacterium]